MTTVNRGRKLLFYFVLALPSVALVLLLVVLGAAGWISLILRDPAQLSSAPGIVRKLASSVYWSHRAHWHTQSDCVEFDPRLLYKPKPGGCVFENPEFSTRVNFDAQGMRLTAAPVNKADVPPPRIVVLGDSHAMGWGVQDDETFASVLASSYGFETLNLAVSSYGTARELSRLRNLGVLRPQDVVLIQYCSNDIEENEHFLSQGALKQHDASEFTELVSYRPAGRGALSVAATLVRILANDVWTQVGQLLPAKAATTAVAAPASSAAAVFLRVLQQFPELNEHKVLVMEVNGHAHPTSFPSDLAALNPPNVAVVNAGVTRQDYYQLDDHLTAAGHEKVAASIAKALTRQHP